MLTRRTAVAGMLAGSAIAASGAHAQEFPNRLIKIIVPFPPGQGADLIMRVLAERLTQTLKQSVIVDNRPGAGGAIGMQAAKTADPDGYTLVMGGSGPTSVAPVLDPKTPYDPLKDFEPVSGVASVPQMFMVAANSPIKTLADLIATAKSTPGGMFYGSSGVGTTQHLFVEHFASMAGLKLSHTPYKGSGPALTDLIGGHIPFISDTLSVAVAQGKAGKVRLLGVTSAQRSPFAPEVPTIAEQGVTGYEAVGWISMLAPAKTPAPILDRLASDVGTILAETATAKRMEELSLTPMVLPRQQLRTFIAAEMEKWRKVITTAGIKVE